MVRTKVKANRFDILLHINIDTPIILDDTLNMSTQSHYRHVAKDQVCTTRHCLRSGSCHFSVRKSSKKVIVPFGQMLSRGPLLHEIYGLRIFKKFRGGSSISGHKFVLNNLCQSLCSNC